MPGSGQSNDQEELRCSTVGIINDTPTFQLEVTIDEQEPSIIGKRQARTFILQGKDIIGAHSLKAKAYVSGKHLHRCQVGQEQTVIFQITGEEKDSPVGRVGWYRTFTHRDFFPHLRSPLKGYGRARPKGLGKVLCKGYSLATYEELSREEEIHGLIRWASQKYRIPVGLLTAVIEVESGFNVRAVSEKGARGLMQLMPATCQRFGVERPFSPQENVEGGAKYLSYLMHQWSFQFPSYRRLALSLAAYHAGERRVELHGGIPPFKTTREYVRKVLRRYRSADRT